ncbi:HAD family hydrolase [Streptomyces sp. NPDC048187]|uniref:HAD family hydrolase n=1 Tax=Streptomyces sp. NPDC048187 TaxID=3365509 RepID=UPI0037167275
MTSGTERVEPVDQRAGRVQGCERPESLRDLVMGARVVLWDFDGPVCRLFAGHPADGVARGLVDWLAAVGHEGVLTREEQGHTDPFVLLAAVDRERHHGDLVAEFEERLTREELRAVPTARPTPYADPLIRTWAAHGVGLAVTTNNSPRAVSAYLATRGLLGCFAPHVYGRTRDPRLLKPDPYTLERALHARGVAPAHALMVGDSPADVAAAGKAGVPFLGYARNDRKEEQLRSAGAEVLVHSLEEVLRTLSDPSAPREGTRRPAR